MFVVLLLSCFLAVSFGAYCHGSPDPNAKPNLNGYLAPNLVFLRETTNGKLYQSQAGNGLDFYVTHLWGTPYEVGYAQGILLKDTVTKFINSVWEYIESEVPLDEYIPELINQTLHEVLQAQADATEPWTPQYWYDEMQGLADATGLPFNDILQVHMLPELTKGSCSMFGAWGKATEANNGALLQLRALDWDIDGPFKDYPAITVYHPNDDWGHTFANIGFTGFIGSITGVSSSRIGISEIGVSYPDSTFGKESRFGYPFIFVLRDVLQFDNSVEDVTLRFQTTRRTCDLILGAGCGPEDEFRAYEYSYSTLNVYDDTNMEPYNETWHPRIENIVYYGMDWDCPNYDIVLSNKLMTYYGNINIDNSISNIVAQTQTGNLHIALYDYYNDNVAVSFHARSYDNSTYQMAYDRPYVNIALKTLFMEE